MMCIYNSLFFSYPRFPHLLHKVRLKMVYMLFERNLKIKYDVFLRYSGEKKIFFLTHILM